MESPAPTFRRPEYDTDNQISTGDAETAAETNVSSSPARTSQRDDAIGNNALTNSANVTSRTAVSHQDRGHDNSHTTPIRSDDVPESHHARLAESAKHAAEKVSRKLHLHREDTRGPSEARQRRQSSLAVNLDVAKLPFYIHLRNALYGSCIMFITFAYWDMAFWSGWSYTWGSILFVIDGAWAWTPLRWPSSEFDGESEYGVGILFFFGAILYQLGATMAYLEAINDGSFAGRAMARHLEGNDREMKRILDEKLHMFFGHMIPHHHHHHDDNEELEKQKSVDPEAGWRTRDRAERPGSIYPEGKSPPSRRGGVDKGPIEEGEFREYLTWRWWPTWYALKTHHIKDMGYLACSIQLFGATLFSICGVIALPGILSNFQPWQELGGYWIPLLVGSVCFLVAGIMFTLVTQEKWDRPLPGRIAWWIGVWASIGSVGFV